MADRTLNLDRLVRKVTVEVLSEKIRGELNDRLGTRAAHIARTAARAWLNKNGPKMYAIMTKHIDQQATKLKKRLLTSKRGKRALELLALGVLNRRA